MPRFITVCGSGAKSGRQFHTILARAVPTLCRNFHLRPVGEGRRVPT